MTDKLIQQASRHSVYTQRFAGHLANLFDPYMDNLIRELKLIMIDAPETTQNVRRINQLIAEYRRAALSIYGEYNDDVLLKEFEPFSFDEADWQVKSLDSAITSDLVNITRPSNAQVWAAINAQPLVFPDSNGVALLQPFIKDWEVGQIKKVGDIIRTGFLTGRTSQQITKDIAGKNSYLDKQSRASIKTMVRTATNHISNIARQKVNADNDDIVIGYEIIATLDGRTSSICRHHDNGRVFNKGLIIWADGSRVKTKSKPMPAFHPNCRTSTAPILDKRYSIDESEETRASKGAEGGQQVGANESYYSWLKKQGDQGNNGRAFVEDVLGKERAKLFLDGGLSAERFQRLTIDELFQPIPLNELRQKQSLQLAFDKID